ncbi:MAG: hypothetical protein WC508_05020 [Patescibacteria group bacterium]
MPDKDLKDEIKPPEGVSLPSLSDFEETPSDSGGLNFEPPEETVIQDLEEPVAQTEGEQVSPELELLLAAAAVAEQDSGQPPLGPTEIGQLLVAGDSGDNQLPESEQQPQSTDSLMVTLEQVLQALEPEAPKPALPADATESIHLDPPSPEPVPAPLEPEPIADIIPIDDGEEGDDEEEDTLMSGLKDLDLNAPAPAPAPAPTAAPAPNSSPTAAKRKKVGPVGHDLNVDAPIFIGESGHSKSAANATTPSKAKSDKKDKGLLWWVGVIVAALLVAIAIGLIAVIAFGNRPDGSDPSGKAETQQDAKSANKPAAKPAKNDSKSSDPAAPVDNNIVDTEGWIISAGHYDWAMQTDEWTTSVVVTPLPLKEKQPDGNFTKVNDPSGAIVKIRVEEGQALSMPQVSLPDVEIKAEGSSGGYHWIVSKVKRQYSFEDIAANQRQAARAFYGNSKMWEKFTPQLEEHEKRLGGLEERVGNLEKGQTEILNKLGEIGDKLK